ncbi:hypothetical protein AAFF_G00228450 [Aldrovandia affinis]|uniref:Uncharacterized protein n=1 Tax=Aldrovandia affinis TaxID=143900 RepID=A0AAD7SV94_9TELE|nr:hypothetical protein AAFF_G00228450 [Aldrovandia affinis]
MASYLYFDYLISGKNIHLKSISSTALSFRARKALHPDIEDLPRAHNTHLDLNVGVDNFPGMMDKLMVISVHVRQRGARKTTTCDNVPGQAGRGARAGGGVRGPTEMPCDSSPLGGSCLGGVGWRPLQL